MVGAGWWAQGWHLPHLHNNPNAEIAAIVDPTPHPQSPLASLTGVRMLSVSDLSQKYAAPSFVSLGDALGAIKDIDGVLIATNHASHHALAMEAMEAGLHVFCEKPMTVDIDEAKDLAQRAASSDLTFMVNNTANWREKTLMAEKMVSSGKVGEIKHATVLFHGPLQAVFDDPMNKSWNEPSGGMIGNGFAWGQLAHPLAWFFMVSGLTPANVFAFNGKGTRTPADMYNAVAIECTNGATVSVSGCASYPGNDKVVEHRLIGTKGVLTYTGIAEDKGQSDGQQGNNAHLWQGLSLKTYDGIHDTTIPGFDFENTDADGNGPESLCAFLAACQGQPYHPGADAQVGLKAVAAIDAIYRSAVSGVAETTHLG